MKKPAGTAAGFLRGALPPLLHRRQILFAHRDSLPIACAGDRRAGQRLFTTAFAMTPPRIAPSTMLPASLELSYSP